MSRITFQFENGTEWISDLPVKQAISEFFDRHTVYLLQGEQLKSIQVNSVPIKRETVEKLMTKFYKQYNLDKRRTDTYTAGENDYMGKCTKIRKQLEQWTAQIRQVEWPEDEEGQQVEPETIRNTLQSAVQMGLDVDPLLTEFAQALPEDH